MVDVHHVIPYVEGIQVVERQLFAFLHAAADIYPVEAVEDFVVGIAADLVLRVDESVVDVLPAYELRDDSAVLAQDGPDTFQL